jgi:hypothetical protein
MPFLPRSPQASLSGGSSQVIWNPEPPPNPAEESKWDSSQVKSCNLSWTSLPASAAISRRKRLEMPTCSAHPLLLSYHGLRITADSSTPPLLSDLDSTSKFVSQEFQFSSVTSTSGWDWTAGLVTSGVDRVIDVERLIPGFGPVEVSLSRLNTRRLRANGAARFHLGSGLRLSIGAKMDTVRSSIDRETAVPPSPDINERDTDAKVLPFIKLEASESARVPWQASIYSGWKPGGYTAFSEDPEKVRFLPEETWTIEGSVMSPGERTIKLAAYAARSRHTQIERSFNQTDYLVYNAATAHILGLELSAIHPITDDLIVSFRGSTVHAVFDTYVDPYTGIDFSGTTVPFLPNYDVNLALEYRRHLGLLAGVRIDLTGSTHYDESNIDLFTQGAYTTLEAWIGWRRKQAELIASGTNLTGSDHYTSIVPGVRHGVPTLQRPISIRCRWHF